MKPLFPLFVFVALSAFSAFMKSYGWTLLASTAPFLSKYQGGIDKTVTIITGATGIWLISSIAVRVLEKIFEKTLHSSPLARKLFPLLKYAVRVLIWGFWVFFLLSLAGINVSALLTGAGVWGLAVAFASKEFASNLFGSLSLIFGKFFKISDRIRIKGFEGTVEEITLSHTRLTHEDGHTIFVPNKYLTAEPVENLGEKIEKASKRPGRVPNTAPRSSKRS